MIDRELWGEVWQVLRANRLRTLLTASGIFWGIFILIVMLGFGNGIQSGVNKTLAGYASNVLYLWGQTTSQPWQGLPPGRRIEFNNRDTEEIVEKVSGIGTLVPRINMGSMDVVNGNELTSAEVRGEVPGFNQVLPMKMKFGRFLNQLDIDQKRKVIVIGERIHTDLFGSDTNPVGSRIQIRNINYTVVGVFAPRHYGSRGDEIRGLVFMPLPTMQQVFNFGDVIGHYAMIPEPGLRSVDVVEGMRQVLKQRHRVAPGDNRALGDWNSETEFLRIERLFIGIRAFVWTVGLATLLAGVLGVSNIMLIAIRERRREFGIRKSIGATPGSVLKMILAETVTLVGVSGIMGMIAGLMALYIADVATRPLTSGADANVYFDTPTIDLRIAIAALVALAIASLLATLIPARHAMNIDPIEALRAE